MIIIKILLCIIFINIILYNYLKKNINNHININNKYRYFTIFISYFVLGLGLKIFVIPYCEISTKTCLLYSTIYSLIIYGIYNLINLIYIKNYKLKLVIYDIVLNILLINTTTFIIKYFI